MEVARVKDPYMEDEFHRHARRARASAQYLTTFLVDMLSSLGARDRISAKSESATSKLPPSMALAHSINL